MKSKVIGRKGAASTKGVKMKPQVVPPAAAINRKKMTISKDQEASIFDTITQVIKGKLGGVPKKSVPKKKRELDKKVKKETTGKNNVANSTKVPPQTKSEQAATKKDKEVKKKDKTPAASKDKDVKVNNQKKKAVAKKQPINKRAKSKSPAKVATSTVEKEKPKEKKTTEAEKKPKRNQQQQHQVKANSESVNKVKMKKIAHKIAVTSLPLKKRVLAGRLKSLNKNNKSSPATTAVAAPPPSAPAKVKCVPAKGAANKKTDIKEEKTETCDVKVDVKAKEIKKEVLDEVLQNDVVAKKKSGKAIKCEKNEKAPVSSTVAKKIAKTKLKSKMMAGKKCSAAVATAAAIKPANIRSRKMKLLSMWNGPKRHRVASLNALAKVHCLYENESRSNFDQQLDTAVKMEPEKKATSVVKSERLSPVQTTRTLRSVPGLRAAGKLWDMHDDTSSTSSSSSSSSSSDEETTTDEKARKASGADKNAEKKSATKRAPVKRRKKKNEVVMDLKDMVVRKRMASLNASAILAASYSAEKRARPKNQDESDSSDSTTESSEIYSSDDGLQKKLFESVDIKKEKDDKKVIEVRAVPNKKKVAVILNQDTDVTITGVYVNSTTRSTHHEGYCSIAGMQYRISATSHTQTASTAVATETILQSSSATATHDNCNGEQPSKSYTPLDALSNMQPPANGGGGVGGGSLGHHHHIQAPPPMPPHMVAPQHVLSDLGRRHGCPSAFSAPPIACGSQGHHHLPAEHHYVPGYYQPAGPLISVPHGHTQPHPKAVQLSEPSPTVSPPPLHQPPPPSSAGDSSDSEVIITSVTTAKEAAAASHQQAPPYRLNHYPPSHTSYPPPYGPYAPQYYPAPGPPPTYSHHDICYSPFPPHSKYMYRRFMATNPPGTQYYQTGSPDVYGPPPSNSSNQQVVTAATSSASGSGYQGVPAGPPPPALIETYPPPPPTLVETYPPPPHYYQSYGPAPPPCYSHSPPSRPLNYATYQSCPCPMQSCPKNVHTGPLTGDSKRSAIAKESIPLPPVALALPLEPASATGPPSPARGSAGMPPPPSPAGATYQPPPPTKQETPEPPDQKHAEKRRKARVGKAMVRNTIAASQQQHQQQNTMLLMCQSQNTFLENVKREVESPQEEVKKPEVEPKLTELTSVAAVEKTVENIVKTEKPESPLKEKVEDATTDSKITVQEVTAMPLVVANGDATNSELDDLSLPCQKTVAENVKVKNMKRKLSLSKDPIKAEAVAVSSPKKPKVATADKAANNGSYKDLIKKTQSIVKINNGKRKLIGETKKFARLRWRRTKRKLSAAALKEENNGIGKRVKSSSKPLTDSNLQNSKQNTKEIKDKGFIDPELIENKEPNGRKTVNNNNNNNSSNNNHNGAVEKKRTVNAKAKKLDNKLLSNVDRTIESVISNARTCNGKIDSIVDALRTEKCDKLRKHTNNPKGNSTPALTNNNCTNNTNSVSKVKSKSDATKTSAKKPKSKEVPQIIAKVPRRSLHLRWSNGWRWEGEPFEGKVFLNSDESTVMRKCYPAMRHEEGDIIEPRDCVLLKAGQRKNELPFVAKIAALWENPEDGEMMMSLLWYYRPEHTEQGRLQSDQQDEVFASRHKDSNSVACIEDKCYVLTFNEYCREFRAL